LFLVWAIRFLKTSYSDFGSSAEVGSSMMMTLASLKKALAMAIFCH
jgi:hypothetical protein